MSSAIIAKPLARTPLYHWHQKRQARLDALDGWQVPTAFRGADEEIAAARAGAGIADVSAFAKLSLRGPGVSALQLQGRATQPRGVSTFWVDAPVLACRLTPDHLLLLAANMNMIVLDKHRQELTQSVQVVSSDETCAYAGFGLIGPRAEELLRHVTAFDLSSLADESCAETKVAGVQALLVRPARLPLPALRLYVSWDLGEYVWETLFEAAHHLDLTPIGLDAWKRLT